MNSSGAVWDNETSNDTDADPDARSGGLNAALTFFVVVIATTALLGNVLVILAVFSYNRLRDEVSNLFIVNLGVTDLCSAVVVMLTSAVAVGSDQ